MLRALCGVVVCMREVSCRPCRRVLGLGCPSVCAHAATPALPLRASQQRALPPTGMRVDG
eukprot:4273166-Prymnesium_polylepis.1